MTYILVPKKIKELLMTKDKEKLSYHSSVDDPSKRDFIVMSSTAVACAGVAAAAIPFVSSWAPDKGVVAVGTTEVNISDIKPGETRTVVWRGGPVFIKNRTDEEIKQAAAADISSLKDPQLDSDRVKSGYEQWLVVIGVCTHLGCVPLSNETGWMCPCHGSHYDTSGRIIKGPAPSNLAVPPYEFLTPTTLKIG